ncbi:MAG: hypothetical protein ACREJ9_18770 [Candidatus Rokuibacteriota bacterium]
MRPRHLALVLALAVTGWLVPGLVHADLKLATLNVKGMVCQA